MIEIHASGGTRKEKELAEKVAYWCVKKLMPRLRNIEISIEIKNLKGNWADVMMEDSRREYTIRLQRGLSLFDLISTMCHEMVHVKQYVRKEMDDFGGRWKTRKVARDTNYFDLPWEKQAFKMESKLAIECVQEIQFNLK